MRMICPYCSFEQMKIVRDGDNLVTCDLEMGGCDRLFLVKVKKIVWAESFPIDLTSPMKGPPLETT